MNGKQHALIGAATCGAFCVAKYLSRKSENEAEEFPCAEFFGHAAIGFLLGSLPDLLEPATSPWHRKFFHSVTAGGLVTWGAFGEHSEEWDPDTKTAVQASAIAYLSHLAADSTTPRSIALVHPRFV